MISMYSNDFHCTRLVLLMILLKRLVLYLQLDSMNECSWVYTKAALELCPHWESFLIKLRHKSFVIDRNELNICDTQVIILFWGVSRFEVLGLSWLEGNWWLSFAMSIYKQEDWNKDQGIAFLLKSPI